MKYIEPFWKNNRCNECSSDEEVKVIEIGNYNLYICTKCREKLAELIKK